MGLGSYQLAPVSSGLDDLLGLGSDGLLGDISGAISPPTVLTQSSAPSFGIVNAAQPFGQSAQPFASVMPPTASTGLPVIPASSNPFTPEFGDIFGVCSTASSAIGIQSGYIAPKAVRRIYKIPFFTIQVPFKFSFRFTMLLTRSFIWNYIFIPNFLKQMWILSFCNLFIDWV